MLTPRLSPPRSASPGLHQFPRSVSSLTHGETEGLRAAEEEESSTNLQAAEGFLTHCREKVRDWLPAELMEVRPAHSEPEMSQNMGTSPSD